MRSYLVLIVLLGGLGLSSCRCADPPDVGPVEAADDTTAAPTNR